MGNKTTTIAYNVFTCIFMAILGSLLTLGLAIETPSITWKVVYGTLFVLYAVAYLCCMLNKRNTQKVFSVIMATLVVTLMSAICSLFNPVTLWAELMETELTILFAIFFLIAIEAIRKDTEDRALKIAIATFFGAASIGGMISMYATYYQFEELVVIGGLIDAMKSNITLDQLLIASEVMFNVAIAALLVAFSFVDVKLIKASKECDNGLAKAFSVFVIIAMTTMLLRITAIWMLNLLGTTIPELLDNVLLVVFSASGGLAIILLICFIINKARE